MPTTFQSREAVRDELVTLFTSNGSWQAVYGYFPGTDAFVGLSPILTIQSMGTEQDMAGQDTNPASYRFVITSWVLAFSEDGSWTAAQAEDKVDELDKVTRQVIRNNAGGGTNADQYRFEAGMSEVRRIPVAGGPPYIVESRFILADLPKGSV